MNKLPRRATHGGGQMSWNDWPHARGTGGQVPWNTQMAALVESLGPKAAARAI